MNHTMHWRIVDTWNGGTERAVVRFTSTAVGAAGHNECFAWIHANTSFSFSEATSRQGYVVEQVQADRTATRIMDAFAKVMADLNTGKPSNV